jgi:hypothetical protein
MVYEVKNMDRDRRKQLLEEYKNRRPEMGVIAFHCKETGETFLATSKDNRAVFNGIRVRLEANFHLDKVFQERWNRYGKEGFDELVLKVLDYEDPQEDHTRELEALLEACLSADPQARKIRVVRR